MRNRGVAPRGPPGEICTNLSDRDRVQGAEYGKEASRPRSSWLNLCWAGKSWDGEPEDDGVELQGSGDHGADRTTIGVESAEAAGGPGEVAEGDGGGEPEAAETVAEETVANLSLEKLVRNDIAEENF